MSKKNWESQWSDRNVLPNKDIDHHVEEELVNHFGPTDSLDHGKLPLRHDRDVDDLDENSPRNCLSGPYRPQGIRA